MKFSVNDFFSICERISSFLGICLHLLKKFLTENFIFVQRIKCRQFFWICFMKYKNFNFFGQSVITLAALFYKNAFQNVLNILLKYLLWFQ